MNVNFNVTRAEKYMCTSTYVTALEIPYCFILLWDMDCQVISQVQSWGSRT